MKKCK